MELAIPVETGIIVKNTSLFERIPTFLRAVE
jgi:hypothetical protein